MTPTSVITLIIAIIGSVLGVISFFSNRKDKSNDDVKENAYKWGSIDEKLSSIEKTLSKIEGKLDAYDEEIDKKIKSAIEHHIKEYHKKV